MIKIKFLRNLPPARHINNGEIIVCENTAGNMMYIITSGSVKGTKTRLLKEGDYFGISSLFLEQPYDETFTAASDGTSVVPVNRTGLFKLFITEPDTSFSFMMDLMNRIEKHYNAMRPVSAGFGGGFSMTASSPEVNTYFPEEQAAITFPINKTNESYIIEAPLRAILYTPDKRVEGLTLIVKGALAVYANYKARDQKLVAELQAGNFLAPFTFENHISPHTILTTTKTTLLRLNEGNIEAFFKYEAKAAFEVLKVLCRRIELLEKPAATESMINTNPKAQFFPPNHKTYELAINTDEQYLAEKLFACPVCDKATKNIFPDVTKLVSTGTDDDSRVHYKDIEPIYYDIISCGNCWYSALKEYFNKAAPSANYFIQKTQKLKSSFFYQQDKTQYTINDVFFAYHFAVSCVEDCFIKERGMIYAKLWMRLSWIYADCGDSAMEKYALSKAHTYFMQAYGESRPDDKNLQPLMITTAAVCYKVGDKANARNLLSKAATMADGTDARKEKAKELWKKYGFDS